MRAHKVPATYFKRVESTRILIIVFMCSHKENLEKNGSAKKI